MASTSQADFVHWPTTLKLRGSIDRNHKDFLPGSFWEALKPWLCSRASSTKWKSYCETMNLKVLLSFITFFFSSPTLPSIFLLACLFCFPPLFLVWCQQLHLPDHFFRSVAWTSPSIKVFSLGSHIQKDIFLPNITRIMGLFVSLSMFKLLSHSWNICFSSTLLRPCLFKTMLETSVLW